MAKRELRVYMDNKLLTHNKHPKYLGVTLDKTLTFKEHLTRMMAKLRTRNNILQKLCGTTWGSSASTLRSSALGLVYPVAEYCAPVWLNSKHTRMVDTQLNQTMRIISGTIRPTPTIWLPTLSNIAPSNLRRAHALVREFNKIMNNPQLQVHDDVPHIQGNRLRSRHPPLKTAYELHQNDFDINERWREKWENEAAPMYHGLPYVINEPAGFDLPSGTWTTLNRTRLWS
ncbi:uncharacterized protein LOC115885916 [Sitophilus oryzae]|uniref:Uncharacterized protein LOC115885916 n=1 Tax=Sitophilus oryzae TaxID=7048 RepID=A0A6J2YD39_SITOR|nr:uncharacterized protein LOC115885916 [Sitophilus oryzae]